MHMLAYPIPKNSLMQRKRGRAASLLDEDLWVLIGAQLEAKDLARLQSISKVHRKAFTRDALWRELCDRRGPRRAFASRWDKNSPKRTNVSRTPAVREHPAGSDTAALPCLAATTLF